MLAPFFGNNARLASVLGGGPALKAGERDKGAVSLLQMALVAQGKRLPASTLPNGSLDGIFGAETDRSVRGFQQERKLASDGAVGPKTLGLINQLLVGQNLPPAPASPAVFPTLPNKVSMPGSLRRIKQPDNASCWAATGTMLWEHANAGSLSPHVLTWTATERIQEVLRKADAKGVKPKDFFMGEFKKKTGLDNSDSEAFFVRGLGLRKASNGLAMQAPGIVGWLSLLQVARGPVAANSIHLTSKVLNHWFIVTGADATRSTQAIVAPPPPGLEFLNVGVVEYYDPQADQAGDMSILDADHRLGVLPEWMPAAARYRARLFY